MLPFVYVRYFHVNPFVQDEEALLCRVATQHDLAESYHLVSTNGWLTLITILQSTGERPPKRRSPASDASSDERLAKRVGGVRLD